MSWSQKNRRKSKLPDKLLPYNSTPPLLGVTVLSWTRWALHSISLQEINWLYMSSFWVVLEFIIYRSTNYFAFLNKFLIFYNCLFLDVILFVSWYRCVVTTIYIPCDSSCWVVLMMLMDGWTPGVPEVNRLKPSWSGGWHYFTLTNPRGPHKTCLCW